MPCSLHHFRGRIAIPLLFLLAGAARAQFSYGSPEILISDVSGDRYGVITVDLNGDGSPDVISSRSSQLRILFNDGSGLFPAASEVSLQLNRLIRHVTAVDLDNDMDVDIAVPLSSTGVLAGEVAVLLNDGAGTFAPPVYYGTFSGTVMGVDHADFDGNGYEDLVVSREDSARVAVLLNDGSGGFPSANSYFWASGDNGGVRVTAGDFDGDLDADIAFAVNFPSGSSGGVVRILSNQGSGVFLPGPSLSTGFALDLVSGDLDGDQRRDLVYTTRNTFASPPFPSTIHTVHQNAVGALVPYVSIPSGGETRGLVIADLDGDGDQDIAGANTGSPELAVLVNPGTGLFTGATIYPSIAGGIHARIDVADLDGDGDGDIVTDYITYAGPVDRGLLLWRNQLSPAPYPGTGEDFALATGVNAVPTLGPGIKTAASNDVVSLHLVSQNGTFDGRPVILVLQSFPTGGPAPVGPLAGLWVTPPGWVFVMDGLTPGPGGLAPVLSPGGNTYPFVLPTVSAAVSVMVQGAVIDTVQAVNGLAALSDAHELQLVP